MEKDNTINSFILKGRPDNFITWKTRFSARLLTKNIQIKQDDVNEESRAANNVIVVRALVMQLDDFLLQDVISCGANDGVKVWAHLHQKYGQTKVSRILSMWKQSSTQ